MLLFLKILLPGYSFVEILFSYKLSRQLEGWGDAKLAVSLAFKFDTLLIN